jgi:FKBP-type peptidyl-prolyl cis-trans isomerase
MMKTNAILTAIIALLTLSTSCNQGTYEADLKTDVDSVSYAIGLSFGTSIQQNQFSEANIDAIAAAMYDLLNEKDLKLSEDEVQTVINNYFSMKHFGENKKEGEVFLEENKTKEGIITLPSGLQYKILKEGTGPFPAITDVVRAHYKGTLIDGTVFDSSYDRGEPLEIRVDGVIKGWTEALQIMPVGSKWMLYIPQELAYGASPRQGGPIEPFSPLIFEIELLEIVNQE